MSVKKAKKLKISYAQKESKKAAMAGGWLEGLVTDTRSAATENAKRVALNRYNNLTAVRVTRFPVVQFDGKKAYKFMVQFKRKRTGWK